MNRILNSKLIKQTLCDHPKIARLTSKAQQRVFDRNAKRRQREYVHNLPDSDVYDYLKDESGYRLADKLYDIKRDFDIAVELSCGKGFVAPHLTKDMVKNLIVCDSSDICLSNTSDNPEIFIHRLQADEETLPFKPNSVDIFISNLGLHWVNYLPNTFLNIMQCLKKDGVFVGCLFGGQTLYQLRCSLQLAEMEREGGFAPHISPFVEPADIGALLNRAGFNMLTIDSDEITINYPTMFELMNDLKGMAESNVAWNRKLHLNRNTMFAAAAIYKEMYGSKEESETNSIPATFQIFNFIGWKPDESQPKPADRGSANFSLKDIENLDKFVLDNQKLA